MFRSSRRLGVLGVILALLLLGAGIVLQLGVRSNQQTTEKLDARITKLGTALTAVVEGLQPDLERLDRLESEVQVATQQGKLAQDSHRHLAPYANALSEYYAALLYLSLDPGGREAAELKVAEAMAFDPVLLSAWEGTQEGIISLSFFDTFLLGKFFLEWSALEGTEPPRDWGFLTSR